MGQKKDKIKEMLQLAVQRKRKTAVIIEAKWIAAVEKRGDNGAAEKTAERIAGKIISNTNC